MTIPKSDIYDIPGLELIQHGKVRDIYAVGDNELLMVTSDRISAFDVVMPTSIPGKGEILTQISNFWFDFFKDEIPNHLSGTPLEDVIEDTAILSSLSKRAIVTKKLKPLPIEAIVRGYLIGSGWKDYQHSGSVCGITLPQGLQMAGQLPELLYTPSTKAEVGDHDINIDYAKTVELVGKSIATQVRDISLVLYSKAAAYALERGIIIADTKFEFGLDDQDRLYLIDEVLTPDSSRFWPKDQWVPGLSPASFDKQFVRDYLESLAWNKSPPAPDLPDEIVQKTAEKYREAMLLLQQA